jgi:hypothetical protein
MSNAQVTIASIVEGDGERFALPKLLHRIAADHGVYNFHATEPWRTPRSRLIAAGGVEKAVDAVATRVRGPGGILVLLDADDDCPAQCGPELIARACDARKDMRVKVVRANREYEAWFLAAAASLAGQHGFPGDLQPPDNPERIRGCKEWLTRQRARGHPYKETVDQAPLSSSLDLRSARQNSPSFDKFYRDVTWLLSAN